MKKLVYLCVTHRCILLTGLMVMHRASRPVLAGRDLFYNLYLHPCGLQKELKVPFLGAGIIIVQNEQKGGEGHR